MNLSYLKFHIGWYLSDLVLPIYRECYRVGRWQCTVPRRGVGVERGGGTFCIGVVKWMVGGNGMCESCLLLLVLYYMPYARMVERKRESGKSEMIVYEKTRSEKLKGRVRQVVRIYMYTHLSIHRPRLLGHTIILDPVSAVFMLSLASPS